MHDLHMFLEMAYLGRGVQVSVSVYKSVNDFNFPHTEVSKKVYEPHHAKVLRANSCQLYSPTINCDIHILPISLITNIVSNMYVHACHP